MTDAILRSVTRGSTITQAVYPMPPVGMYDTAVVAYSFRRLRDSYAGSAVRIRRSSDSTEQDIGFDGSGDFDESTAASFIGGGSGFIVTWYDQSGNGVDVTNSSGSAQPTYSATGLNGMPTMIFDQTFTTRLIHASNSIPGPSAAWTIFTASFIDSLSGSNGRMWSMGPSTDSDDYNNTTSLPAIQRNSSNAQYGTYWNNSLRAVFNVTYNVPNIVVNVWDGTNNTMYVDAVAGSSVAAGGPYGASLMRAMMGTQHGNTNDRFSGAISELILWASDKTSDITTIDADMGTYWGL